MNKINLRPRPVLSALSALVLALPAHAAPTLTLSSGISSTTVQDNGPGDNNPSPGQISFTGAVGLWIFNATGGISRRPPTYADGDRLADMDLSTTSQTIGAATGGNALTIRFSDDSFGPTTANFTAQSGGTLRSVSGNNLTYSAQVSPTNTKFTGTPVFLPTLVFTTGIAYSGTRTGSLVLPGPYALTQTVVISHGGAGVSTTDSTLTFTPGSGCIGNFVWNDLNQDGIQDAGEPGINSVRVVLTDGNGVFLAETTTMNNGMNDGYYQFSNLVAGDYKVVIDQTTLPSGLIPTQSGAGGDPAKDSNGSPAMVNLPTNTSCDQTIDFGYKLCAARIGNFVWEDLNRNGMQDGAEPGINGVTVNLLDSNGMQIQSTTTNPNAGLGIDGWYQFEGLCDGTYTVVVDGTTVPAGKTQTTMPGSSNGNDGNGLDSNNPAGTTVTLNQALGRDNQSIDFGYQPPAVIRCVELNKTAASPTAAPGSQMEYTYVIHNCGNVPQSDLKIVDDNGTPGDPSDDFTVAMGISLLAGETKTYTYTVYLRTPLCTGSGSSSASAGTLTTLVLPSGDIRVTLSQSRNLNDNAYGSPGAVQAGWSSHSFGNLTGSDKAEFRFKNGANAVVLDFYLDYISQASSKAFPSGTVVYGSGYGTLGANGGDGQMVSGNVNWVLSATTSLTKSINSPLNGCCPSPYLVNSPTPEASFPNWDYVNRYTVTVSKDAFGPSGFGGVTIPDIHNSPAKTGSNQVTPVPCGDCITNTARVLDSSGMQLAQDDAMVCVDTPPPQTPPCMLTPGTVKIDRKTVQLPIKNNGTADVFLSEVAVSWNQMTNGNLVKMSLNGDFWVGSAPSGTVINSGFNADATKRKIAKGQTKTLVLTFTNDASKVLADYSGTIKFGSDSSCAIAFPPAAPPAPFDCDGHIATLKMKWAGSQPGQSPSATNVNVVAHYGGTAGTATLGTFNNVTPGQVVEVNGYTGSPNDVIWEIFDAVTNAKIGESQFHTSCSDSSMDGPEDCGSAQGNGKSNITTVNGFPTLNYWRFAGLKTIRGTTLTCP